MDDFALDSVDISPRSGEGRGEPMLSAPVAMAVFTIAGAESSAMPPCWPVDECRRPPATAQRLHGPCLGRLADDTVLLCSGRRLLALGNDGRLRVAARSPVGRLVDADAATDGSVIMAGEGGVARITPDRAVRVLARVDLRNEQARVAATADGGAVIAKRQSEELLRVDPAGQATPLSTPGDVRDVTALPDGALAIALQERVVRVGPDGAVATVAGGGRGFQEGARATSLGLSDVSSVSAAADGALLVSARHGVLRVDSAGRITTVVRAVATSKDIELGDPRAADADGLRSDAARLSDVVAVQAAAGEQALALTPVPGQWSAYRLAMLAARPDRLAVAVPASARTLIRRGRLELVSTRRAAALVEIRRGRRLIASRRVALRRGNTRLSLRVPLDGEAHVVRVVARARDGAVASHQMALIPGRTLSEAVVRRLENLVSLLGVDAESEAWIDCRRRTAVQFECDNEWSSGGETARSRATLRLRPDGLIRFHERDAGDRDDLRLLLEPLTYDPRPG